MCIWCNSPISHQLTVMAFSNKFYMLDGKNPDNEQNPINQWFQPSWVISDVWQLFKAMENFVLQHIQQAQFAQGRKTGIYQGAFPSVISVLTLTIWLRYSC